MFGLKVCLIAVVLVSYASARIVLDQVLDIEKDGVKDLGVTCGGCWVDESYCGGCHKTKNCCRTGAAGAYNYNCLVPGAKEVLTGCL